MSSPFFAPRPVYVPFSGTCDANGNLTIKLPPIRESAWTTLKMTAKVSAGNPIWEMIAGSAGDFSRGQRCSLASFILPPTAAPIINVIGAAPSAAVTGSFIGVETYSPEQAVQWTALVPSMVGAEVAFPSSIQLWSVVPAVAATPGTASLPTVTAGQNNQNFQVNIPPGTRALRVLAINATQGSTAAFTYSMRVESSASFQSPPFISGAVLTLWPQGAGPGVLKAPLSPGTPVYVPMEPIWGLITGPFTTPQAKFIITGDPSVDLQFFISALFDIESVDITAQQPLTVSGTGTFTDDVTDRILRQLGRVVPVDSTNTLFATAANPFNVTPGTGATWNVSDRAARQVGIVSGTGTFTVQEGTSPPPWQMPNQPPLNVDVNIAASGTATLVAAVGGQVVRLFACELAIDTTVATGAVRLEDTSGNLIHEFNVGVAPSNPFHGYGVGLATGAGVILRNLMGANAAVMRGSLVYSQS